jgi:regulator of RNase E activity RraA
VTISYFPTCSAALDADEYNFGRLFLNAVGREPAGKVLVLASNGHPGTSLAGGTKLSRAHNHDLAGVLADGRLRDFDELAGYSFSTYCRGEATRWGGDVVTPFQANIPVVIEGVGIRPGDYIHADSSGVVAIPAAEVRSVVEGALAVTHEDEDYLVTIREEVPDHRSGDAR